VSDERLKIKGYDEAAFVDEVWKAVPNYDGYFVSNFGRVKSTVRGKERLLKLSLGSTGYWTVYPKRNDGVKQTTKVHKLMGLAFGFLQEGHHVNHIDGVKTNNRLDNLESVTPGDNVRHAVRTGLLVGNIGSKHGMAKINQEIADKIRAEYIRTSKYRSNIANLVLKYGVSRKTIWEIIQNRRWVNVNS